MKKLFFICLLALSGCAGTSTWTIRPYTDANTGATVCCEATVTSSRDVGQVQVNATKTADGNYTLTVNESDISASKPITAQTTTVNAVSNAVTSAAGAVVKLTTP